jgi:Ca2+-binding RTX toxin-like protein
MFARRRHRRRRTSLRRKIAIALATGVFALSMLAIYTAAVAVPASNADLISRATNANDLKPPQCAGINLTNLVTGSGVIRGTAGNDLMLGSGNRDRFRGNGGTDCMVGGGGNDVFWGNGPGAGDVCIAGPGGGTTPAGARHCDNLV